MEESVFVQLLNRFRVNRKSYHISLQEEAFLKSCENHPIISETLHSFGTNTEVDYTITKIIDSVSKNTQTIFNMLFIFWIFKMAAFAMQTVQIK